MPIKPENKARYPASWKEIRSQILERASHKCEGCGLGNGWIGWRDGDGEFHRISTHGTVDQWQGHWTGYRLIKIVLTVAHLDHQPENVDRDNLRAWCQKCHLTYDAKHHAETAYATRKARAKTNDLFHAPGEGSLDL